MALNVIPITTNIFPARGSLVEFIRQHLPQELIREKMILAVTSKIVSLAENRLVPFAGTDKKKLIRAEADADLGEIGYGCHLTIKAGLFIASAGIDESNSANGDYILYPENPFASAQKLWTELRRCWGLSELGIILTDSHTTPLRRGVTGISLAHWGFEGVRNLVGSEDLFGRILKMTTINQADALAAAATLMMGEGRECTPLAVLAMSDLKFQDECNPQEVQISPAEDLYAPIYQTLLNRKET